MGTNRRYLMEETPRMEEPGMPVAAPELSSPKTKKAPNAVALLGAGLGVAVVVGAIIWYVLGIQSVRALSESSFALTTARIFRIPVATINNEKILYTEYADNLRAMKTFYDTDTSTPRPSDAEMSDYIISRLLINRLVSQVAQEYKTSVTKTDLDAIVNTKLLASFESKEKAEEEIMKRYGWTLDQFVQNIVEPTELEQKLSTSYLDSVKNPTEKEEIKAKAQSVLDRIKKGESFEKLAKECGSDSTAEQGGDLGWFARGVMVSEFENAAFSLKKGQLASELVETQFGFHIIRVDDKRTTKSKDGKSVEEVKARHILFKVNDADTSKFTTFMNQRLLSSEIKMSKGLRNPFEEMKNNASSTEQTSGTDTTATTTK